MCALVKPELSSKNKYWIERHRYYELKHFCLQYPTWKKAYLAIDGLSKGSSEIFATKSTNTCSDPTARCATAKAFYSDRIEMLERLAKEADSDLAIYILKAVTEDLAYNYLKTKLDIPCCRDTYYDRYRKFFWLLSKERK